MLLWLTLLILGEGTTAIVPGPTPDTAAPFGRRRLAAFVKQGGVNNLRGRTR